MSIAEPVVKFLLQKLGYLLAREANLLAGVDEGIRHLVRELERIRCFLKDADGKCNENESVKNWVKEIRELGYSAEDAIDTFILQIEMHRRPGFKGFLKRSASFHKEVKIRHTLGNEIININKRVDEIRESKPNYVIENLQDIQGTNVARWKGAQDRRRASYPQEEVETQVVGVTDAVNTLKERLTAGDPRLTVVSIVGTGGLGKTTVAQKLYKTVRENFSSCHAWVSVSLDFSVIGILKELLKQLKVLPEMEMEKLNEQELKAKLSGFLKEKKYLIVLDDIWSTQAWDGLISSFPESKNGSRIILTTRYEAVALHAQSWSPPHKLRFLDPDESWELFLRKAFPENEQITCPEDLETLGREIVKKCGGLPLAIVVIGGILSTKQNEPDSWRKVLKSRLWELKEGPQEIKTILALSYNDLPYHLKSCFLYCSVFPEDFKFDAKRLILWWIAEGFIEERGEETMEEVAEEVLEELISRSMIQASKRDEYGKATKCRLHDLLRDLADYEAKAGNFFAIQMKPEFLRPTEARRLALWDNLRGHNLEDRVWHNLEYYVRQKQSTPHLRSFLAIGFDLPVFLKGVKNLFAGFQLLRVLDIKNVRIPRLPDKIRELIHLRFLGLSSEQLKSLPSSIENLRSLQTLDLSDCTYLERLPRGIWRMQCLRHLFLSTILWKINMPDKFSGENHLTNLQSLKGINTGGRINDQLQIFKNLRNLQMNIRSSTNTAGLYQSIAELKHLSHLELEGHLDPTPVLSHNEHIHELALRGYLVRLPKLHEFPSNLIKLKLEKCKLSEDPFATLEKLTRLRRLSLKSASYSGRELKCSAQGFPQLEHLILEYLWDLEVLNVEGGGMPSLRRLHIDTCPQMMIPPSGLDMIFTFRSHSTCTLVKRMP